MDKTTKNILEQARRCTPRHLYRLFIYSHDGPASGGHVDLNTPSAITPPAFFAGRGKPSVYDMTKETFAEVALAHLRGETSLKTEFSSWAASLAFVLNFCPGVLVGSCSDQPKDLGDYYIGVIDTKQLWHSNQIYHVPKLDFLSPGNMNFDHEYLAHGVIKGPAYRAVCVESLFSISFTYSQVLNFDQFWTKCIPVKPDIVQAARKAGELFGSTFAMPMTLAILCCVKRDYRLYQKSVMAKELDTVLNGIKDLKISQGWDDDEAILTDVVYTKNFSDVGQTIRLMRALVQHCQDGRAQWETCGTYAEAVRSKPLSSQGSRIRGAKIVKMLWTSTGRRG